MTVTTISIILCTYNRCESLRITLNSLAQVTPPGDTAWELIVVDNNSTDQTQEVVTLFRQSSGLTVRYVFEGRPGLSYARNAGIENAGGDIIIFTDDDVLLENNWLVRVKAAFDQNSCAAIGGRVRPLWPGKKPAWFQEDGPYATPKAIVSFDLGDSVCVPAIPCCGANMAFRRDVFARHGLFRTDLGRMKNLLLGGEDVEYFCRLKDAGEPILYIPDAIVFHPVPKERMRKEYVQSWCFSGARSEIRLSGLPRHAVYYWDIPRFLFRTIAINLAKWLFTSEPRRRFYYKLQVYIAAGTLWEIRKVRRCNAAAMPTERLEVE
jgi:glycosyltransferase involved in cell wall biosynthesis